MMQSMKKAEAAVVVDDDDDDRDYLSSCYCCWSGYQALGTETS